MKKLFYIVLVIVVLLVISKFVKNEAPVPAAEPEAAVVEETVATPDETAGEIDAVVAEPANIDNLNDGEVVEEGAVEVEEANPAATAEEDETIVKE